MSVVVFSQIIDKSDVLDQIRFSFEGSLFVEASPELSGFTVQEVIINNDTNMENKNEISFIGCKIIRWYSISNS